MGDWINVQGTGLDDGGVQSLVSALKSKLLDNTLEHFDWDQVATNQNKGDKKIVVYLWFRTGLGADVRSAALRIVR